MNDPYCYENCEVLRNKLGIRNDEELSKAEVEFSCNAIHELGTTPLEGDYDFAHLCAIHNRMFRDIYEWAGKPRTVDMEKAEAVLGYMSIEYAKPEEIRETAETILAKMKNRKWEKMSLEEQAENISADMAELWKVHPFREGNTRTTITFVCQFADSRGMFMNRDLFEKNSAYMRNALVAASAVYQDADFRKMEYLYNIVKDSLKRGREKDKDNQMGCMSMNDWKKAIKDERKKREISEENKKHRKEKQYGER